MKPDPNRKQSGDAARDAGVREKKKPGRKPGDGGRNNPETNPTPLQREQQEKAFYLALEGKSTRAIAEELNLGYKTVAKYIRIEERRRSEEMAERRDLQSERSVQTYELIKRKAFAKSDRLDRILGKIEDGFEAKVTDHSLDAAIKAQERIDKIRGVDAPSKIDVSLQRLEQALTEPDDPSKPLS